MRNGRDPLLRSSMSLLTFALATLLLSAHTIDYSSALGLGKGRRRPRQGGSRFLFENRLEGGVIRGGAGLT